MSSIIKKKKKGRTYYYAVKSGRVNGEPRIVWQKYLGTVDAIVKRAEDSRPPQPKEAVIFELGGVASLLGIAGRLGLMGLINDVVPKRDQGPTVGHYMVLAAINRALCPLSKLAIGDWYEQTVLRRLWGYPKKAFSSQRFWDHMGMVSEDAIEEVEERLARRVLSEFSLDTSMLLYDTTNFFTFLATTNDCASLPQRGHSKAKRHDLRQVGLALLATREFQVPLLHRVYPGNINDVALFPELSRELSERYRRVTGSKVDATMVFDKGNVSDDAMENLVVDGIHFVAALTASRFPELMATPQSEFSPVPGMPGSRAHAAETSIWGKECRLVVTYTESFFTQQLSGVTNNLAKCQKKLADLEKKLSKWHEGKGRGRKPTLKGTRKKVSEILSAQFMGDLIRVEIEEEKGLPRISYRVDHQALRHLTEERLGKNVLVTDRLEWSPTEVVESYRSLTSIEDTFKNMKNVDFLRWQPAYHWTDQKIQVHGFYCVLALMLSTLTGKVVSEAGIDLSLPALLKDLSGIREVAVIYPPGTLARPRDHTTLSRMSPRQKKLLELLSVGDVIS
ncbi:MAG: IS1634 family transposase [Actinomycetia bacterium]|nr:IS1634 family transposase [Actinomycetes bacterium]